HILFGKYSFLFIAILLFALSIIFSKLYTTKSSISQDTRELEKYLERQQHDFDKFTTDTSLIRKLVQKKETLKEFNRLTGKRYGIFLYVANDVGAVYMKFWSDQMVLPPQAVFPAADGEYFYHLSNGYYIAQKRTISVKGIDEKILAIAMIPVRSEFFIKTDYLPREFAHSKDAEKRVFITDGIVTEFPVKSISGKTLFYLDKKTGGAIPYNDRLTILLRLGGVAFLFLFLHLFAEMLARRYGPWIGIATLTVIVVALRMATYYFPSLVNLRQFELFDPAIYGSNAVQRSLGDLLLNAALFCWIVLFAWSRLHHLKQPTSDFSPVAKWAAGILSLCLLIYYTFLSSAVIRSIVADSKISFDVTNFASLTRYSVFGFLVLAILILSYYYFTQLLFRLMFPLFAGRTVIIYFVIGFAGLTFLTIRSGDPDVLFFLPVLLWLLGYTWLVNREGLLFNRLRVNISGILFWIFVFSISISAIMLIENSKAEWEKRKSLAYKQAKQVDKSNENLLSIALEYLDNDYLQDNYTRFTDPETSRRIRDSILTDLFTGYLDKYDTRLYLYDSLNRGMNNDDGTSYDDLNTLLTVQAQETAVKGIYYYETSFEKFIYITQRNFQDTLGRKLGSLFIISNPRNTSGDALFPELFKQLRQNDLESSPIYSYAVYEERQLKSPSNKYPFPIWIENSQVPKEEFEKRVSGDYDELWYRAGNDKVIVITRKRDSLIETITLFSYIFCSLLFLVFIVQFISFLLKWINNKVSLRKLLQLNIRTQVHSTIIFVSIFSFLIIGVSTISFFIGRYERSNTDKLSRTMKIMVNEMEKEQANHEMFDDVVKIYDTVANTPLQKLVDEVSDIHGVDVNVYDLNGDLKVSSEANVYTKGVLSRKMDPTAYFYLDRYRQVKHSQVEKIGNFSYLSIYAPVRGANGNADGYINIPYFTSTPELNQEISNFLVTLINLNAFIFLVAGLIALFITNRITRSFSVISDKMREVNLGKLNEEIAWNRDDEIGELVKGYNKM
ncbi:MAG TPA: hypothetical protein VHM26_11455, partial [Chitinophagaceae bacterium]|nr:hypothetical protein [Chitinophagaceae bacterium]